MDALQPSPSVEEFRRCDYCLRKDLQLTDRFCRECGFPLEGTDAERSAFTDKALKHKKMQDEVETKVRHTRNWLFVVAGLNMIPYLVIGGAAAIISGLVISLLFVGLAFWTKQQPYPALLAALVLYVSLNLLTAIDDPTNIVRGILIKIIIIGGMIKSLKGLHQLRVA